VANIPSAAWRTRDGWFDLEVTLPPNTTVTLVLPEANAEAITESGRPQAPMGHVGIRRRVGNEATLSVAAGTYKFTTRLP